MANLVFDLETDGLLDEVTTIWCMGYSIDGSPALITRDVPRMLDIIRSADVLIGHNIIGYDLPVLNKLYGFSLPYGHSRLMDTYILSKMLYKKRQSHSLKNWGKTLGNDKGDHTDWSQYSEEMAVYCRQDVDLNLQVYNYMVGGMAQ